MAAEGRNFKFVKPKNSSENGTIHVNDECVIVNIHDPEKNEKVRMELLKVQATETISYTASGLTDNFLKYVS